jgi:hypothetical protein
LYFLAESWLSQNAPEIPPARNQTPFVTSNKQLKRQACKAAEADWLKQSSLHFTSNCTEDFINLLSWKTRKEERHRLKRSEPEIDFPKSILIHD